MVTDGQPLLCLGLKINGQTGTGMPNLKKLSYTLSESFFVNGVEIDAHENKNTIGANLSSFMADLVVYELLKTRKHLS